MKNVKITLKFYVSDDLELDYAKYFLIVLALFNLKINCLFQKFYVLMYSFIALVLYNFRDNEFKR